MKLRRFNLTADQREDIIAGQVVTEIHIPFWKRVKMLFCSLLRVTVPMNVPSPHELEDYASKRTLIRVETRRPIKPATEVAIPFESQHYMNEGELYPFVMEELMKQFIPSLREVTKIEMRRDPIQGCTVVRGVIGVVDMRNC